MQEKYCLKSKKTKQGKLNETSFLDYKSTLAELARAFETARGPDAVKVVVGTG